MQSIAAFVVVVPGRLTRLVWSFFGESDIVCFSRPYEAQQVVVTFFLLSTLTHTLGIYSFPAYVVGVHCDFLACLLACLSHDPSDGATCGIQTSFHRASSWYFNQSTIPTLHGQSTELDSVGIQQMGKLAREIWY